MPDLFAESGRLWWLWLLLPAVIGWVFVWRKRRRAVQRFVEDGAVEGIAPGYRPSSELWRGALGFTGAALLIVALARPQWGEHSEPVVRWGVDVVIALDGSRSMRCEDVSPSRFERARLVLGELLDSLEGDRVSLVSFSGRAAVACPLTLDYGAVRLFLDAAEPDASSSPGTDISAAIRTGVESFETKERKHKVVIVVTDGEDHEPGAVRAASEARETGVVVHTLGVGTESGGPIPLRDLSGRLVGYHRDPAGSIVTTRLGEKLLAEIARAGGGRSFRLEGTGLAVERLFEEIEGMEKKEHHGTLASRREERYRWPLAAALLLLAAEVLVPRVRGVRERAS
jgi:Ca-activated chloride channel family protein